MTDKIKNYLGWALIVAVLALALAALGYVRVYSRSSDSGAYRSFGVAGQGKIVAVPDIAHFSFSVVNEGETDIGALQKANVSTANAVIDYLKKQKVEAKNIATESYHLEPRYQTCFPSYPNSGSVCPPASIVGYTVRQTVSVKVRQLDQIGNILAGVVERGANNVSQLDFAVDHPEALEAEARGQAIAQAKSKAKAIAKVGGFSLGRLLSIEDANYYPGPVYGKVLGVGGDMVAERSSAPAPLIEPGSQEIVVNVMLRYEIR